MTPGPLPPAPRIAPRPAEDDDADWPAHAAAAATVPGPASRAAGAPRRGAPGTPASPNGAARAARSWRQCRSGARASADPAPDPCRSGLHRTRAVRRPKFVPDCADHGHRDTECSFGFPTDQRHRTAPWVEDHRHAAQGLAPATEGRLTYQRHSDLTRVVATRGPTPSRRHRLTTSHYTSSDV